MSTSRHTHSEGRQLPPGWRWVRLGTVLRETRNGLYKPDTYYGTGTRILKMFNIGRLDGTWDLRHVDLVELTQAEAAAYALDEGDILFNRVNSNELVGKCAVVDPRTTGAVFESKNIRLRLDLPQADPWFVAAFLNSQDGRDQIGQRLKQIVGQATVNRSDLDDFLLPLPALPEQQRLTALLKAQMAAVEKARAAAQARMAAAYALPAAFLRQVFGDASAFAASPVTPTKPVHPGWTWHRLTDIARLATGHTPSRYHPEYWRGAIPWLQLADIRALDGHEAHDTSEHANELGIENSSAVLLPAGTVCMSRTASVGFFAIMGRPMATSQDFVNWVCGDALDPWFLMYLLIANRKRIRDLGSGAVHQTIYFPTVQAFSVCVPPIAEQRRLAGVLREQIGAAERACAAAEEELAAINALPAALLRRAFAGEL